jgi:hypothetical protein
MGGTWHGSMQAALAATLARPAWWTIALAAFLLRGGILLILLPIVFLPTPAAIATAVAPTLNAYVFGGLTLERFVLAGAGFVALAAMILAVLLAGAWLDHAQLREAGEDDDLDLTWAPVHPSARDAVALRLAAHLPTLAAFGYGGVRLVVAGYTELLSPGDASVPLAVRIVEHAPDAVAVLVLAWLVGETVGGLAARRAASGGGVADAMWRSIRQLLGLRGLATLLVTTLVVAATVVPFMLGAGRAWEYTSAVLLEAADVVQVIAALFVLVLTWILGLAIVGAALAWRTAAWTAEIAPRRATVREVAITAPAEVAVG